MKKDLLNRLVKAKNKVDRKISRLNPKAKASLEKSWDVEHAYYSSALEGSKIDRQEFEALGRQAK